MKLMVSRLLTSIGEMFNMLYSVARMFARCIYWIGKPHATSQAYRVNRFGAAINISPIRRRRTRWVKICFRR